MPMKRVVFLNVIEDNKNSVELGVRETGQKEGGIYKHGQTTTMAVTVEMKENVTWYVQFRVKNVRGKPSFSDFPCLPCHTSTGGPDTVKKVC